MCAEPNQIPPASALFSDPAKKVQLTVTTGDTAAEIFVIDGGLQLCARDIGKLTTWLAPGIYKLKIRTGFSTQEEHVVLRDSPVTKYFPPLCFSTPIPLANTAKSHEYHQSAAVEFSQKVQVTAGQGSSIFIFARDWTSPQQTPNSPPVHHPAAGLKLKAMDGAVVGDIAQASITSAVVDPDPTHDPWAACTIAVNQGAYRLSVDTPDGEFEQIIIAPPNWHVHVFLLQRSYGSQSGEKRPDVARAAITLSQAQQFTPNGDEARLVELARLGLTEQRKVLSSDLRQMLKLKFADPMLGILAGHLILTDPSPDLDALGAVVANLRMLLFQYSHPDVEALALKLGTGPVLEVSVPPMLRRSWSIILDASSDQKAMVMRGSLAAAVVGRLRSVDPWLIWVPPEAATAASEEHEIQESVYRQVLSDHFTREERSASNPQFAGTTAVAGAQSMNQQALLANPRSVSQGRMKQLIRSLGVPRFYLEDMLKESGFTVSDAESPATHAS